MDAGQIRRAVKKIPLHLASGKRDVARTTFLPPLKATASSPLGELAPWPSEARLPGPSLEGRS